MFVDEMMHGRFSDPPVITEFDNVEGFDQLIVTGPIDIRSTCAHHLMPIYGEAYIGVLPAATGKIIGLSKYDRIVDYFCRPAADPGRAGQADRPVHHGKDVAAWGRGAHQRGSHVQDAPWRACKPPQPDGHQRLFRRIREDPRRKDEFLRELALLDREP